MQAASNPPNPSQPPLSPRIGIDSEVATLWPAKASDTNPYKEIERAQRLSATAVYPTQRRTTHPQKSSLASATASGSDTRASRSTKVFDRSFCYEIEIVDILNIIIWYFINVKAWAFSLPIDWGQVWFGV